MGSNGLLDSSSFTHLCEFLLGGKYIFHLHISWAVPYLAPIKLPKIFDIGNKGTCNMCRSRNKLLPLLWVETEAKAQGNVSPGSI